MESQIRALFDGVRTNKIEGLLVDCADWGINIRMSLDDNLVEVDLIKNWDGFEVIILEEDNRQTLQIDELQELLQVMQLA